MKVLIVEDTRFLWVNYQDVLDSRPDPVEYDFAVSYDEFIEKFEALQPDVVWTDHRIIGEKNGADIAHWLRDNHPNIPCLRVSSFRESGYPPGVTFLGKRYSIFRLYQGTKIWLETGTEPDWDDVPR